MGYNLLLKSEIKLLNIMKSNNHSTFNQPLYVKKIFRHDCITNNIRNLLGSLNIQKLKKKIIPLFFSFCDFLSFAYLLKSVKLKS